ncbi:DUF3592 domain-containing protein [Luteolibacter arcticus]|uniref:DUF3592 domain-containing protein n=1 Tax=Luteolibacter arcticus TaxID=1581411 RepID=A0ABT3GFH8_9BACT|nr:DUF3592 domain-containing protein [Luteolibacter arcticus]MCW1922377.1 DUF3592 domain-containing protein [Luteolibacter arcticus]
MKKAGHLFCILLVGGGIIAAIKTAVALANLWHDSAVGWTKVPCVIREFEVETNFNHRKSFRVKTAYDYHAGGAVQSGRQAWPGQPATDDYEDISNCVAALTEKSPRPPSDLRNFETECLVDPEDPTRAVLIANREAVAFGFGLTAAVLLWIGAFLFFYRRQRVSRKARLKRDPILLALFLFFAVSGVAASVFTGWGLMERWRMRCWIEVPATVVNSQLQQSQNRKRGRDPGVRASILYRYEIDGREYLSNRTTVLGAYSGSKRSGERVRSHPPGTAITVFIDPDKPWRAVVDRNLGSSGFFLLFPLPFLALGGFGVARFSWPERTRGRR